MPLAALLSYAGTWAMGGRALLLRLLALLTIGLTRTPRTASASPGIAVDKHLFLNASTFAMQKSRIVLNHPRRAHEPALVPTKEWERWGVYASNQAIRWNATEYRLYYQCDYGMDSTLNWRHDAICLAVSPDGKTWTKPSLGVATFKGSTDNNILLPIDGNMSTSISIGSIFNNTAPGVPDSERWVMTVNVVNNGVFPELYPVNKGAGFSAYVMVSAADDGIHWRFKYNHSWVDDSDVQVVTTGYSAAIQKYITYIRFDAPPGAFPSNPSCRDEQPYRSVGMCVSNSLEWLCGPGAQPGANGPANWPKGMGETTQVFKIDKEEPTPQTIDDQVVDVYRNAATLYESGDFVFFAGLYRHFRTSLTSPGCGKNNAGHPPNGFTNDGLVDVRFLIGGRHVPSPQLEYVQTLDARSPWIPLDVNRCEVTGDVDTFGGWCANTAEDLQHTSVGTGTLWMNPGYVVSANGEEIYIWGSAQAFTHGSDAASVLPAGSTQPWGNNTAIERYILRRDGFTHVQGEYVFNVGYHDLPMVTTEPIRLATNCSTRLTLKINVVTSVVGYVLVEVVDAAAKPQADGWRPALPGYDASTSISIKGNYISRTVAWGDAPRQRYGAVCASETYTGHCSNATWEPGSRLSDWETMTCAFANASVGGCGGYSCGGKPGVCNAATGLCEVPPLPSSSSSSGSSEEEEEEAMDDGLCMFRNVTTTANYRDSLHELAGREVQIRLVIPDARVYSIAFECE